MSTSPSDRDYHHGGLRAALLAAALERLEDGGAASLSLRAIARDCGVSAMAPYRHFADKDALLDAVAGHGFGELARGLREADSTAEGAEALAAQGTAYVAFACRHPALFRLMFTSPCGTSDRSEAYAILERRAATLAGPEMSADDLTLAAWSLVHGLAGLILDRRVPVGPGEVEGVARRITFAFARLMAGRTEG